MVLDIRADRRMELVTFVGPEAAAVEHLLQEYLLLLL
jgi:hypothetical protein